MRVRIVALLLLLLLFPLSVQAATIEQIYGIGSERSMEERKVPVLGTCRGSDVNVREQPSKTAEVIGLLQEKERVYILNAEEDGRAEWKRVELKDGTLGYVYGVYISEDAGSGTFVSRFRAAFETSAYFDMKNLEMKTRAGDVEYNPLDNGGYANAEGYLQNGFKVQITKGNASKLFHSARVTSDTYPVAGMRIGDPYDVSSREKVNMGMLGMGWDNVMILNSESAGHDTWYLKSANAGWNVPRPVKEFIIEHANGFITSFSWSVIVID